MLIWSLPLESGKSRLEKARNPSHTWNCRQPYCGPVSPYQHPCVSALAYWRRRTEHRKIKKKKKIIPIKSNWLRFPRDDENSSVQTVLYWRRTILFTMLGTVPLSPLPWSSFKMFTAAEFSSRFPLKTDWGRGGEGWLKMTQINPIWKPVFFFFFLEKKH